MSEKRKQLIKKLLNTNHLNNLERKELIPLEVSFIEICESIERDLDLNAIYPTSAIIWSKGLVVDERCIIKKCDGNFSVHLQRANPTNNYILAEKRIDEFKTARDAIKQFCKLEYPQANIDGIKIV